MSPGRHQVQACLRRSRPPRPRPVAVVRAHDTAAPAHGGLTADRLQRQSHHPVSTPSDHRPRTAARLISYAAQRRGPARAAIRDLRGCSLRLDGLSGIVGPVFAASLVAGDGRSGWPTAGSPRAHRCARSRIHPAAAPGQHRVLDDAPAGSPSVWASMERTSSASSGCSSTRTSRATRQHRQRLAHHADHVAWLGLQLASHQVRAPPPWSAARSPARRCRRARRRAAERVDQAISRRAPRRVRAGRQAFLATEGPSSWTPASAALPAVSVGGDGGRPRGVRVGRPPAAASGSSGPAAAARRALDGVSLAPTVQTYSSPPPRHDVAGLRHAAGDAQDLLLGGFHVADPHRAARFEVVGAASARRAWTCCGRSCAACPSSAPLSARARRSLGTSRSRVWMPRSVTSRALRTPASGPGSAPASSPSRSAISSMMASFPALPMALRMPAATFSPPTAAHSPLPTRLACWTTMDSSSRSADCWTSSSRAMRTITSGGDGRRQDLQHPAGGFRLQVGEHDGDDLGTPVADGLGDGRRLHPAQGFQPGWSRSPGCGRAAPAFLVAEGVHQHGADVLVGAHGQGGLLPRRHPRTDPARWPLVAPHLGQAGHFHAQLLHAHRYPCDAAPRPPPSPPAPAAGWRRGRRRSWPGPRHSFSATHCLTTWATRSGSLPAMLRAALDRLVETWRIAGRIARRRQFAGEAFRSGRRPAAPRDRRRWRAGASRRPAPLPGRARRVVARPKISTTTTSAPSPWRTRSWNSGLLPERQRLGPVGGAVALERGVDDFDGVAAGPVETHGFLGQRGQTRQHGGVQRARRRRCPRRPGCADVVHQHRHRQTAHVAVELRVWRMVRSTSKLRTRCGSG